MSDRPIVDEKALERAILDAVAEHTDGRPVSDILSDMGATKADRHIILQVIQSHLDSGTIHLDKNMNLVRSKAQVAT